LTQLKETNVKNNISKNLDIFIKGISNVRSEIAILWEELNLLKLNNLKVRKKVSQNVIR
jgi:regulator of replication initiation timing